MRRLLLTALIVFATACQAELDPDFEDEDVTAEGAQPIVNGTTDNGHLAVGEVLSPLGSCSGTLIGARWVITAAHCVSGQTAGSIRYVRWGSYAFPPVERWEYTPDLVQVHGSYVSGQIDNDVALLRFAQDVNTTPIPIHLSAPALANAISIVGFGLTGANNNDAGTRRIASNAIDALATLNYRYDGSTGAEGNTCSGDSGGATLRTASNVQGLSGVHSSGNCGTNGYSVRVDQKAAWIVQRTSLVVSTVGWRNPNWNLDVNADGFVSPSDALVIINYLNAGGASQPNPLRTSGQYFLDTNGDGFVSSIDALLVINYLNGL